LTAGALSSGVPQEAPARVVRELASRGYNAEREAVTLLAGADDSMAAIETVVESLSPDTLKVTREDVEAGLERSGSKRGTAHDGGDGGDGADGDGGDVAGGVDAGIAGDGVGAASQGGTGTSSTDTPQQDPSVSTGEDTTNRSRDGSSPRDVDDVPVETKGEGSFERTVDEALRAIDVAGDVTGHSTGTGAYDDFVSVFRDRYDRLGSKLRGRVNHRPTDSIEDMVGGSDVGLVGMVNDLRSTKNGHWIVELEDTNGVFPCLITKGRDLADLVDELLFDEVIAIEGTLSDDGEIVFVDELYFPDVPRTYEPSTADRHVQAALISDVHVGSQEFMADAWHRFADWLHTEEAEHVEYLLIAGDMVEGVGVYPNQDEELDVIDLYEQYERFSEYLKEVPGDMEIVMIPGNHDAVRLAEPQPGFDEELRDIMTAHDAKIVGNPSTVTVEGVSILMYHGVSLDEVIAEFPEGKASYDDPHKAMYHLLKKRHVAPQYGGHTRVAPENQDYLVIDDVPDVFHTGHVHKLGFGKYHNVLAINSGCWQAQTDFQKSVNIDPDVGYAPIVDLDTLDVTARKFV
jgi:DNA polymerase II small subunit